MRLGKRTKQKIKKGCEGAVSLLLCILMTPFLTLVTALMEFSGYQETAELANELMDSSALSVLANFDSYLEERFGLFGIQQDCDVNEEYKTTITENASLLGKSITLSENTLTANGSKPLSDLNVLKTQLMDFSESTVLTEILLEDLNLGELLKKLDNLAAIKKVSKIAEAAGALSEAVSYVVEGGKELLDKLKEAIEKQKIFSEKFDDICISFKNLVDKFSDSDDITFDNVKEDHLNEVEDIYKQMRELIDCSRDLYECMKVAVKYHDELETKISTAYDKLEAAKKSNEEATKKSDDETENKSDQNVANENKNIQDVGDKTNDAYENILNKIRDDAFHTYMNRIREMISDDFNNLVSVLKNNVGAIVDEGDIENYFSDELSSSAKADLNKMVSLLGILYSKYENNGYEGIKVHFKNMLPDFCFPDELLDNSHNSLDNVILEVGQILAQSVADASIGNMISLVEKMFNIYVSYFNPALNAYVPNASEGVNDNPYADLLSAIVSFIEAGKSILNGVAHLDVIQLFKAVGKVIKGVVKIIKAIYDAAEMMLDLIGEFAGYIASGNWQGFYERLLLSGYMVHNFPNRTMANYDYLKGQVAIKDQSLTGYNYGKIEIPHGQAGEAGDGTKGLERIMNLLSQYNPETTINQEMFKGAELEYIAAGTQSEIFNQVISFMQLYMLRLLLDITPILTNSEVSFMATAAGPLSWVVYIVIIFLEPLCDTILLVNTSEKIVPLFKTTCFLSKSGIPMFLGKLEKVISNELVYNSLKDDLKSIGISSDDENNKNDKDEKKDGIFDMDYKSHFLLILMFTVPSEDILIRARNLINLETAYHYKQKGKEFDFTLDNAFTSVDAEAGVTLNSFVDIFKSSSESAAVKSVLKRTKGY